MRILLVNPPVPHINLIRESHTEAEDFEVNKRELMGPPLALNDIAGVCEMRKFESSIKNSK